MNDYKIFILFIFSIICISIIIKYVIIDINLFNKQNTITRQEGFLDYQDVKTKTLNWCNKMQKAGLLNTEQFNQCVSSFNDTLSGAGINSSGLDNTKNSMDMNYSLYNTRAKHLSNSVSDNTNIIMLITPTPHNKTLACKPDGSLYHVSNTDDSHINQAELFFTLQPINDTSYAILSPYGAFLTVDNTYNAGFTSKNLGPFSTWNVIKINNTTMSNSNINQVMIESTQYPGFYLEYLVESNTLNIQQGQNDSIIWSLASRPSSDNISDSQLGFNISQYTVIKENILNNYKNNAILKLILESSIDAIKKLQTLVSNNYADITNYIQNYLQEQQRLYQLSSSDYKIRVDSIKNNSMINPTTQQNIINNLPKIQGLNITSDIINEVLNTINNQKNITLQYINNNALIPLQQQLEANNINDISLIDFNKFIKELNTTLQDTNNQITQNNKILARQKDKYNTLNHNYNYQLNKINKLEKVDEIAELNVGLLSNYQAQKTYLTKIYPIGIFFLVVGFIYLSYLTYNKFITNVWSQYKN